MRFDVPGAQGVEPIEEQDGLVVIVDINDDAGTPRYVYFDEGEFLAGKAWRERHGRSRGHGVLLIVLVTFSVGVTPTGFLRNTLCNEAPIRAGVYPAGPGGDTESVEKF